MTEESTTAVEEAAARELAATGTASTVSGSEPNIKVGEVKVTVGEVADVIDAGIQHILSKAEIFAAPNIVTELVEVPEWAPEGVEKAYVYVRSLSGDERDVFEESLIKTTRKGRRTTRDVSLRQARAKLCALCISDRPDGRRLFSDEEITELGRTRAAALDRIYEVASRLNRLGDDDLEELTADFTDDPS